MSRGSVGDSSRLLATGTVLPMVIGSSITDSPSSFTSEGVTSTCHCCPLPIQLLGTSV